MKSVLAIFSWMFLSGQLTLAAEIPVISRDSEGGSVVREIPSGEYLDGLTMVVSSIHSATRSRLDSESFPQACQSRPGGGGWDLKAIVIGIGAQVDAGLGPIIGVSAKAAMRMIYSRHVGPAVSSTDPTLKGGASHASI